jgi:hypothetical protein
MGALDSASSFCRVLSPLAAGVLADKVGASAPFGMCALACAGGIVALRCHLAAVAALGREPGKAKTE